MADEPVKTKTCGTCQGSGSLTIKIMKRGVEPPEVESETSTTCPTCQGARVVVA